MIPFRGDLHCHSSCSDGSLKPLKLLALAIEKGLQGLSITDHDTIAAYTPDLFETAKQANIQLLPGVEFSTVFQNTSIHVLGYGFDLKNSVIAALCERHRKRRINRYRAILQLLHEHHMPITEEELLATAAAMAPSDQSTTIGRPHIAQAMLKRHYVESIHEAFKRYLGDGCSCYVQGDYVSPEETIEIIHQAGGVAIIAHPHIIKNPSVLSQLLKLNFDGIECYYSRFSEKDHKRWVKIAQHHHWLITGGSDFHGDIKPLISLGCSWIDEEHFTRIAHRGIL